MNDTESSTDHALPALSDIPSGSMILDGDTLALTGEIDGLVIDAWHSEHPTFPAVRLVDASRATFIGSAGLALLAGIAKAAHPKRANLHSSNRAVLRPLEVTGVRSLFDLAP